MKRSYAFVLSLLTFTARERSAAADGDCKDVGCVIAPFSALLSPLILAMPVGLVADVYYTPGILGNAISGTPPSLGRAKNQVYWTSWQGLFLGIGAARAATSDGLGIAAMPVLALTTWPLAITAHGAWYWASDNPAIKYSVFGALAGADAILLGYDVFGLAQGQSFTTGYAILESWTAALQTTYGLASASHLSGKEMAGTLALSSGPVLLLAHGISSLIVGHKPAAPLPRPDLRRLTLVPSVVPREGGADVVVAGSW